MPNPPPSVNGTAGPARTARKAGPLRAAVEPPAGPQRSQHKGQQTRATILDAALRLSTQIGLEGLSIGALAEVTQMSKSGVFAHFGSREELQISVIREYHRRFEEEVFFPAMSEPRGLPRLRSLFERWVRRVAVEVDSGCIYISGAVEFDDRPGPVRDALAAMVSTWHSAMHRAIDIAIEEGHLAPDADTVQMLFEIHGLILALHYDARFLRNPGAVERARRGLERILAGALVAPAATAAGAGRRPAVRTPARTPDKHR
jgi:AcrR family transcriptional regulator